MQACPEADDIPQRLNRAAIRIDVPEWIVPDVGVPGPSLRVDERLLDVEHRVDGGEPSGAAGIVAGAEVGAR